MALFDFWEKRQEVSCASCDAQITPSEVQWHQGKPYCAACFVKLALAEQENGSSSWNRLPDEERKPSAIQEVEAALHAAALVYKTRRFDDQWEIVIGISGKSNTYQIRVICKDNGENDVAVRVFALAHFPWDRRKAAYHQLTHFQRKYRFLKFTLDQGGDVDLEYDFPSCTKNIGRAVTEIVRRTIRIVDEVYPELMRTIWGQTQAKQAAFVQNERICPVCGNAKEAEAHLCRTCFSRLLLRIRSKEYLLGQIHPIDIWDMDYYRSHQDEIDNGSCRYCGGWDNPPGRICWTCSEKYMDKIMQRARDAKESTPLLRARQELFLHIRAEFPDLKLTDVSIGPTPAGGAYAVRQEIGEVIYIGEYDENYVEINHTRGYNEKKSLEKGDTIELPTGQIQQLQEAINKNYPGLQVFVRDVNLPPYVIAKYRPDEIIREKACLDASARVGGMVTNCRYVILSNHMIPLPLFEHGTDWQLHIARMDSRFKVLGTHTYQEKTAIFLLHLPDDESWKLFQKFQPNLDRDLLENCKNRFEAKCTLPPIPELAKAEWLVRCKAPVGMDDYGNFWELE